MLHSENWYCRWGWRFHLKLLQGVSLSETKLGVQMNLNEIYILPETTNLIINCNGIYFSSQEEIAYFLAQEAVHLLIHFEFLRA